MRYIQFAKEMQKRKISACHAIFDCDLMIVNVNVEGATNRLLNIVNGDEEQIKKVAEDFHITFSRRAQGQI